MTHAVLIRIAAALATLVATTFGGWGGQKASATVARPHAVVVPATVDAPALVLAFGDALDELHDALGYENVNEARVRRACDSVLAQYPALHDAVGSSGTDLLVAAESMVDACRTGLVDHLDVSAFEIVDGDYYAFRELSFDFAK